ncbi:DEAD/DEAH box helicase [Psychromarinibacter sp. C21-152]|uniref:DEAD/DEAH box helicase n=1 Tax=Psychromarinibacter sediminicola TaxID=3033385 RepID=A0AAE3NW14_9RHOB|nr:DEAD/DEAH box helicase [Psychromarinibacter sediminicola]MDF0603321.1 DEAD/DEAH box helicase [Psychromarinibacter sediminicola]
MELRDYQVVDLTFYYSRARCGNFSDPGTGKTAPTCVYIYYRWKEDGVRTIWTMPKSLLTKNRNELLDWSEFAPEDVVIVDGTPAKRKKLMESDGKCFLMGFDCFAREWHYLVECHPEIDMLVGDEWHLGFKSDGSNRTQSLYTFMQRTTYLVAMTGTIIDGRLDSAYPLIELCEPGNYIGGHDGFLMAHAIEDSYGRVVAWRDPQRVGKIFGRMAIRHTFEEAYGPEAKIIQHETCEMEPRQRDWYDEFEEEAILELEDSWLDGTMPGVNLIRCRQLMEHPQEFGPPLDTIKETGKEERLRIHLEDHKRTGKPLVIFSALTAQHDRVAEMCEKMGFKVGVIDGRISAARRAQIDEQFQDGEIDIVIASAATAGIGYNWGHVDQIVFMSLDYMDSNFVQAYRRAVRGKRETPVLITVMEYENSVDQKIFEIVERKSKLASDVDPSKERIKFKTRQKESETTPAPTLKMADFIYGNSG